MKNQNEKVKSIKAINDEVGQLHPLLTDLLPKFPGVIENAYTHGSNEFGADFVVTRTHDVFKTEEYIGIIAKSSTFRQNTFSINQQIEECLQPRLIRGGKNKIHLSEVWIVASDTITNNAKLNFAAKYASTKLHFIDAQAFS